ncbi:MAG TPA: hypothetical protein DCM45_00500 [Clostridiales bacterium]|nr:hypothetical protein [Clostridiales bacterium]
MYFNQEGKENTEQVATIVADYVKTHGIKYVVVASVSGYTADIFLQKVTDAKIVVVTHVVGSIKKGVDMMGAEKRADLIKKGAAIVTAAHALSGVERGISSQFGGTYPVEIMAHTLRMFGSGVKVGIECATMALDNGAIPYEEDVVAVGGSRGGADAAILIRPGYSSAIFETKVKEIICKPR